jgi:hypothetical protein
MAAGQIAFLVNVGAPSRDCWQWYLDGVADTVGHRSAGDALGALQQHVDANTPR